MNSQNLAAYLTPGPCIACRAWPNFKVCNKIWEYLLALRVNSTRGLMPWWWKGTIQQARRTTISLSRLPRLVVLGPRALTPKQLIQAENIYAEFKGKSFRSAHEAYKNEMRKALD